MVQRPNQADRDPSSESSRPAEERREAERFTATLKLSVTIESPSGNEQVMWPAMVRNISRVGVLVESKRPLSPSQRVTLAIPTTPCPEGMHFPQAFIGPAGVVRVGETPEGTHWAALRFGESLTQNTEFMMFMNSLYSTAVSDWLMEQ
jgi:hypothetical protein